MLTELATKKLSQIFAKSRLNFEKLKTRKMSMYVNLENPKQIFATKNLCGATSFTVLYM
jgi:hypothetical protein